MVEPADFDHERLKHARALELEMIRATAAFEHAALKLPFALNGGALGIYLALYSSLKGGLVLAQWAWVSWIIGIGAATLATFAGFLSQFAFRKDRGQLVRALEAKSVGDLVASGKHNARADRYGRLGSLMRNIASVLILVSFTAFFAGVAIAFSCLG